MIFNNNFRKITVTENGIILTYKTQKILFSELDKTHVKVNKMRPVYTFIIIWALLSLGFLSYLYLQIDLILLITFFLIVFIFLKMNEHKSYSIKIRLKNGEIIEEKILAKLKLETINSINEVQKGIYNYKINNKKN
ncbi:hypothetical protein EKL98_06840 [Flavobacterium bomense]|uniref:Uncharacterized protein n=2 Tax=Flavobacterium TaxID=237 RepID=A0A432CNI8_9FLAO|nr:MULTISPECIES: hypothetical protein [Flavobacterium]RTY65267.1 hypothetical protein EKL95_13125 [Flavobacterium sp. LB2P53]RTZ05632.1 hypothetical protein EKL98_06840 [Flavobacterium bomense]